MSSFLKNPTVQIVAGYFPKLTTIILAVVCFALGMVWAYGINPVQYVNGSPAQLEQSFQDQWVLGAAGRQAASNFDNTENVTALLSLVDDPAGIVNRLRADPNFAAEAELLNNPAFDTALQAAQPQAAAPPPAPNPISNIVIPIVVLVVFAILIILGKVLWTLLIYPFIEPLLAGRETTDASLEIARIKRQRAQEAEMKTATVDTSKYGEPIIRKASLFQAGFGNYDDSFNIETADKTYYGEAGSTIAEKIGEDGVTAIEVWMFDKDEFTNTPAAIFASEHAFNDPTIRSRLEPRGEVVKMEPGAKIILETDGIYVEATVRDVNYDESAEIPKSVITDSSIEIIAWSKSDAPGGGSSGGGSTVPDTVPAPAMPMGGSEPTPPASAPSNPQPLTPPPLNPDALSQFAPPEDQPKPLSPPPMGGGNQDPPEDPFAGAGDFTPVNPNR